MRHLSLSLAFLGVSANLLAAPVPKVKTRPDAEVFIGNWETVIEGKGRPISKAVWSFDAELKMEWVWTDEGGRVTTCQVKLAPEKSPKEIDIGGFKGIYEFDGEDIKVAFGANGRPKSFTPRPGAYCTLLHRIDLKK